MWGHWTSLNQTTWMASALEPEKKTVRKSFTALFTTCFLIILFVGCGNEKKDGQSNERVIFYRDGGTYAESYALFTNGGPRCYYDVEHEYAGPYCFDPGCEHKRPVRNDAGEVIRQGCLAYDYTDEPVFLCGDYLYFISSYCLYRADRQGNERKKIVEFTAPYEIYGNNCYYTEEALYIAYSVSYEYSPVESNEGNSGLKVGKQKEKPETGVLRIPFIDGKEEVIFHSDEQYAMQIVEFWSYDGHLIFMVQSMDRPSNYVDYNADNWKELIEDERCHTFLEVYDYCESTGEIKRIVEPRSNIGIYFFSKVFGIIEEEPGHLELFRYSGEKVGITEESLFFGVASDKGIIGWSNDTHEWILLDELSGKVMKRSPITRQEFSLSVVVGESCYGYVLDSEGNYVRAWISFNDLWEGNRKGMKIIKETY